MSWRDQIMAKGEILEERIRISMMDTVSKGEVILMTDFEGIQDAVNAFDAIDGIEFERITRNEGHPAWSGWSVRARRTT